MPVINVKFRHRPEVQTSRFSFLTFGFDHICLADVTSFDEQNVPHINEIGVVYLDACDLIIVDDDGKTIVIFDREDRSNGVV